MSVKQFGYSFAFDAPTVFNSLPVDVRSAPSPPPLEHLEENSSHISFPGISTIAPHPKHSGADPYLIPGLFLSPFLVLAPHSLLYAEIEHYKSPIDLKRFVADRNTFNGSHMR